MEISDVDKVLNEILAPTTMNETKWDQVSNYFSRLVEAAEETMIIQWPNMQVERPMPYVQLRKDSSSIYLEALSSFYVPANLPPDTENSLLSLGWQTPEPANEDGRNFNIEFYGDEPDYKVIGEFIMKTFRYGYACTLTKEIEVGPENLAARVPYLPLVTTNQPQLAHEDGEIVKKKGKKIFPSLVNKDPLPPITFETLQERNRYVVEKRSEGYTLQAIADSLSLTREMIRLIVNANSGPSANTVREIRKINKSVEIRTMIKQMTQPDVEALAERLDVKPEKVKKLLGAKAKNFPQGRRNFEQEYTNEELIAILQKYSKIAEGPLSAKKFVDLGGTPTIAIFFTRFGSWMKACEAAGVESGKVARDNYTRAHSQETMLAYIESYLADPRTNGSALGYDIWQRSVEGAPSLALIRQRMGRWNDLKARILRGEK
jgi:transcriptional regulator with XRE-family HTH domain